MFDGIQRPLEKMREMVGSNITRGMKLIPLDREKKWKFVPAVKKGHEVIGGDIVGKVQETIVIEHRIMIPNGIKGKIIEIYEGEFTVEDTVAKLKTDKGEEIDIKMMQKWPVRRGRPYKEKLPPNTLLMTGQE